MMIKAYRKFNNLTQSQVAEKLGICPMSYCRKENGKQDFTLKEAKKISDLFGLTIEEIFFTEEPNKLNNKNKKINLSL